MTRFVFALILSFAAFGSAHAVPVNFSGTVINGSQQGGSWSWLHGCATPTPCDFMMRFMSGSVYGTIDLEEGELEARRASYDLRGTSDDFYMHSLSLEFNTTTGRVNYGVMEYSYLGVTGSIDFDPMNMGLFNSLQINQDERYFSAYLWGGDASWTDPYGGENATQGLGIDFAFHAQIPEPGTLALMGLGLLGLAMSRRRRV